MYTSESASSSAHCSVDLQCIRVNNRPANQPLNMIRDDDLSGQCVRVATQHVYGVVVDRLGQNATTADATVVHGGTGGGSRTGLVRIDDQRDGSLEQHVDGRHTLAEQLTDDVRVGRLPLLIMCVPVSKSIVIINNKSNNALQSANAEIADKIGFVKLKRTCCT